MKERIWFSSNLHRIEMGGWFTEKTNLVQDLLMADSSILKICSTHFQKLQGLRMLYRIAFWVSCRHHKCHEIRSLGLPCVSVLKTLNYKGKWFSDSEIECILFSSSVSSPHTIKTFSVSTSKRFYFRSHIPPLTQSSPTQLESLLKNCWIGKNYLGLQFTSGTDWWFIIQRDRRGIEGTFSQITCNLLTQVGGYMRSDNLRLAWVQPPTSLCSTSNSLL